MALIKDFEKLGRVIEKYWENDDFVVLKKLGLDKKRKQLRYTNGISQLVIQEILSDAYEENCLKDLLDHFVGRMPDYEISYLNTIIPSFDFQIRNGKVEEVILSEIAEAEREKILKYAYERINPASKEYLSMAQASLRSGDPKITLINCRLALESLTKEGNFKESLEELVKKGLLSTSYGVRAKTFDFELLQTLYGYLSTLGNHTDSERKKPTLPQATVAYLVAEAVIYLLVTLLDNKTLPKLSKWDNIS